MLKTCMKQCGTFFLFMLIGSSDVKVVLSQPDEILEAPMEVVASATNCSTAKLSAANVAAIICTTKILSVWLSTMFMSLLPVSLNRKEVLCHPHTVLEWHFLT